MSSRFAFEKLKTSESGSNVWRQTFARVFSSQIAGIRAQFLLLPSFIAQSAARNKILTRIEIVIFYRLQSYNPSTQVCCSGTISSKPAKCCGSTSYNPSTHTCCRGRVVPTSGNSSPGCCGGTVYDRNQKVKQILQPPL